MSRGESDWSMPISALRRKARSGDPDAGWALGRRLKERDPREALRWFRRVAEEAPEYAQILGTWYAEGESLPQSPIRAVEWFRRAALGGDPDGMRMLGVHLLAGEGVRRDAAEGFRWLRRAVRAGEAEAALELCKWSWLERRDRAAAARWAREAALRDEEDAFLYEAWLSGKGRGTGRSAATERRSQALGRWIGEHGKRDVDGAIEALERLAPEDPVAQACFGYLLAMHTARNDAHRGWVALERAASSVPWAAFAFVEWGDYWWPRRRQRSARARRREANRWLLRAARGGHPGAQNYLGETLRESGDGRRRAPRAAVRWFRAAARQGHPGAQTSLGVCLHYGEGVRRDDQECVRWYRSAARRGEAAAMHNLALCYRDGHGVSRSARRAVGWLERSAARGDLSARVHLARTYLDGEGVRRDRRKAVRLAREVVEEEARREGLYGDLRGFEAALRELSPDRRSVLKEAMSILRA